MADFEIMNRCDQVEPQAESALLVAISTGQNAESLHRADDMLDADTHGSMQPVKLPLLAAQALARLGLEGQIRLGIVVLDALITLVEQARRNSRTLIYFPFANHRLKSLAAKISSSIVAI